MEFDITSLEDLNNILKEYNIDTSKFVKPINRLYQEVVNQETTLIVVNNELIRKVYGVGLNLYYFDNQNWNWLREEKQVFKNGKVRHRNMFSSIAEKSTKNENKINTVYRGLEEELNIKEKLPLFSKREIRYQEFSMSYNINTEYEFFTFETIINDQLYKPQYLEIQEDKTTYFNWIKLPIQRTNDLFYHQSVIRNHS